MNFAISDITFKAIARISPRSVAIYQVVKDLSGLQLENAGSQVHWIEAQSWIRIAGTLLSRELVEEETFYKAGKACRELGLLGPCQYLPLFLGSPALLYHNAATLCGLLDTILTPRKTYVGEESLLIEMVPGEPELIQPSYLEFVRGFFEAAALLWQCEITDSRIIQRERDDVKALAFNWNIQELHGRRALEELLIEREFFTEMFEGLKRISESHDEQYSPLLDQNIRLQQALLKKQESTSTVGDAGNYDRTVIYDGYFSIDDSYRIKSVSPSALRLLSYKDEQEFFNAVRQLDDLLVRDAVTAEELISELDGMEMDSAVFTLKAKGGTFVEVDISAGSSFSIAGEETLRLILRDATLAKKLNLPMEPTRQIVDALFVNNPAALQIIDSQGWTTRVNRQFETMFGIPLSSISGIGRYNIFADSGLKDTELLEVIKRAFYQKERDAKLITLEKAEVDSSPLLKNIRDSLVMEVVAFPLSKSIRGTSSVIVSYIDVTESHLNQQQLAQTDKLRSIGTLASGIAHDFNNILGAIVPNADFIMSQSPADSLLFKKARTIKSASKRASELMRQLMTYARQSRLNKQPMAVNICVSEAMELIRNAVPKSVNIVFERGLEDNVEIMADPLQMQQLLINLIINASDAQPDGGFVGVSTRHHELNQRTTFGGNILDIGAYVCISVEDNGHGMSQAVKERIFDPFFTTKEKGRGTGLGLSVVHGIVKNHRGYIDIQSIENSGTTFSVFLPLSIKEQAPSNEHTDS